MIPATEDAIIARLRSASGLGYKPLVESYGGELDDELERVVRSFPAFWVTFAGSGKPVPMGTSKEKWLVPLTFAVMAGARNIRGERATRHGVTVAGVLREPGVYQMLDDACRLLLRQDFGLAISPLIPGAVRSLYNTRLNNQALAVFAQEWHTQYVLDASVVTADLPQLLTVGMNYHLPPDDGNPDAQDTVTLS
jgi:phage gp37-like protein